MEYMNSIQAVWTVTAFIIFIGILIWAFSSKRRNDFFEASLLALDEDDVKKIESKSGEQHHV